MTTIEQIKNMDDGTPVFDFECRVKDVYERKSGEGEHGPWSFQGILLEDSTGSIRATVKNRDEVPQSLAGKTIKLSAVETNYGHKGVMRATNAYEKSGNRHEYPEVKITPVGQVTIMEKNDAGRPANAEPKPSGADENRLIVNAAMCWHMAMMMSPEEPQPTFATLLIQVSNGRMVVGPQHVDLMRDLLEDYQPPAQPESEPEPEPEPEPEQDANTINDEDIPF